MGKSAAKDMEWITKKKNTMVEERERKQNKKSRMF